MKLNISLFQLLAIRNSLKWTMNTNFVPSMRSMWPQMLLLTLWVKNGKVYVVQISGGNDKQGFPMKQGVLTHGHVLLLLSKQHSCYGPRWTRERKCNSVWGSIVDANLSVLNVVTVKKSWTH